MTIVAGIVNDRGVLLCCDTLVGNGLQSSYRSKLIGCEFCDGRAIFGYSGEMVFSESAIQRCTDVLENYTGKPRTIAAIVDSIRKLWAAAYQQSYGQQPTANQILIAVHSKQEQESALYVSTDSALARSTVDYECIGCGDLMCKYFLGKPPLCGRQAELRRVVEHAILACSHVKTAMPTAVGGHLIAVNLARDGQVYIYGQNDVCRVESWSLELDSMVRDLSGALFPAMDDDAMFREILKRHTDSLIRWKELCRSDPTLQWVDHVPPEAATLWQVFNKATK